MTGSLHAAAGHSAAATEVKLTDVLDADQQEGHDGGHKGRQPLARLPQGEGQQGDVGDDEAGGVPLQGRSQRRQPRTQVSKWLADAGISNRWA